MVIEGDSMRKTGKRRQSTHGALLASWFQPPSPPGRRADIRLDDERKLDSMCGLFAVIGPDPRTGRDRIAEAHKVQSHRGPDGQGDWEGVIARMHIALGHQRLAILDLSDAGHQPMVNPRTGSALVWNGELYNYLELRSELEAEGIEFIGHSDTEVLHQYLETYGPERSLPRFNFMGAFVWVSPKDNAVFLARDRASEKPLYYLHHDGALFIASEVKTLFTLSGTRSALDSQTIGEHLVQGLADVADRTFLQSARQLPAAHWARIDLSKDHLSIEPVRYWTPRIDREGAAQSFDDHIAELQHLLTDAVRIRLRSDVPVGVLLSGGLDSSTISSIAKSILPDGQALNLFSAVSNDPQADESEFIDAMAGYLGEVPTKHELRPDPFEFFDRVSELNWLNDQPIMSFSIVSHNTLMKLAHDQGITVILSGQGSDELFCGYLKFLFFYLKNELRQHNLGNAFLTFISFAANRSVLPQFRFSMARRYMPRQLLLISPSADLSSALGPALSDFAMQPLGLGDRGLAARQALDVEKYSVPCLAHTEDRMSMGYSREIRLPFLDYRIIDHVLSSHDNFKLRNGWTKYSLRRAMESRLPAKITWRRDKRGFSLPEDTWLRGMLRSKITGLLSGDCMIYDHGIVQKDKALKFYSEYCAGTPTGRAIWGRDVFKLVSLELFLRRFSRFVR